MFKGLRESVESARMMAMNFFVFAWVADRLGWSADAGQTGAGGDIPADLPAGGYLGGNDLPSGTDHGGGGAGDSSGGSF